MRAVIDSSEKRLSEQRKCNEEARARQLQKNVTVALCGLALLGIFAVTNIVLLQSVLRDPLGGERQHRFIGPLLRERLTKLAREGRNRLSFRHGDRAQTEQQLAWARAALTGNSSKISGHVVQQIVEGISKKSSESSEDSKKSLESSEDSKKSSEPPDDSKQSSSEESTGPPGAAGAPETQAPTAPNLRGRAKTAGPGKATDEAPLTAPKEPSAETVADKHPEKTEVVSEDPTKDPGSPI
ncbi:unnamed protein product [Symbiodinium sp. CCMP2592]|nr:unnamed protein product [Symbiodinium sp. CCMP2592]